MSRIRIACTAATCLPAALFAILPRPAPAGSLTVPATVTASPRPERGGGDGNNDNLLRAFYSPGLHIDGAMKFDIAALPDDAVVTAMTLTTYRYGEVNGAPEVQICRIADDSWSRGGRSFPPDCTAPLTGTVTGNFTAVGEGQPFDWPLDVSAVDWREDIADDTLSLVMRNRSTAYSFVYWYGSGGTAFPGDPDGVFAPTLEIDYMSATTATSGADGAGEGPAGGPGTAPAPHR